MDEADTSTTGTTWVGMVVLATALGVVAGVLRISAEQADSGPTNVAAAVVGVVALACLLVGCVAKGVEMGVRAARDR